MKHAIKIDDAQSIVFSTLKQGDYLLSLLPSDFRSTVSRHPTHNTSNCAVVFDKTGDCKLILAEMEIHKSITPELVCKNS